MNSEDAQDRLSIAREASRRSARRGAVATAAITAVLVIALGVVVDLEMPWLLGLVALGFVGLSVARPVKLRLNWSDRTGAVLLVASGLVAVAVYLLMQWLTRSAGWDAPNTFSALAASVVILVACLPALMRLATRVTPIGRTAELGDA